MPTKNIETDARPPRIRPAILCDFDGTVANENVAELLLQEFADSTWLPMRHQFQQGFISLKEYQEQSFRTITASRRILENYVSKHASIRPYFRDLSDWCRIHGVPLAVTTYGLDFYVKALLKNTGIEGISYSAVITTFGSQGLEYNYPHGSDKYPTLGNCKCQTLNGYRQQGYQIIYIGDGILDFCPASRADLVFARSGLANLCQQRGIPFHPCLQYRLEIFKGMEWNPRRQTKTISLEQGDGT